MVGCTCCAVASYLGFGTLCGSLGAKCFIFSAPIIGFPSKSGLVHKHIVKTSRGGHCTVVLRLTVQSMSGC
jgi:hypothetical protein